MSIEKVRDFFSIKYVIPYDVITKVPKCILRAIGEVSYSVEQEAVELVGGHVDAPFDVEYGQPSPSLTGVVREYPHQLFQLMETTTVTENAAEANGSVGTFANAQGTTVKDASNGVSAVAVKTAAKSALMFGRYILRATGAQTLELLVAGLSDGYLDQEGQVVATISAATPGTVDVDAAGITITVTGTAAFTTGNTAYFEVRPENTGSTSIVVGTGTAPSEFGVRCIFPKKTDGVMHWIDIYRVSGRGMPWKGVSREFSEFDINWKPLSQSDGSVYEIVRCLGV